jgi:formylmethanofuran dehydrogenase subunit E
VDDTADAPGENPVALVECQMCHRPTPENTTAIMTGRRLCAACAAAWFDEDEDG